MLADILQNIPNTELKWFEFDFSLTVNWQYWKNLGVSVIFLQFCLYGSWDSLGPEFMHPKLKLCIQPGTRGEIFCCVLDFSFQLLCFIITFLVFQLDVQ